MPDTTTCLRVPRLSIILMLLIIAAICAAFAALVLNQATFSEAVALSRITFHNGSYQYLPVRVSADEFSLAQGGSLALAAILVLTVGVRLVVGAGRRELAAGVAEMRVASHYIGQGVARLSTREQWVAGLCLALLTVSRIYFGIVKSYHSEEVASYDFFISRGLLAVTSFYPIPNNHVLPNTLNWLFFQVSPNVWFTLRLPVLLISTAGTMVLFAGLVRIATFRTALIALTLFSWMQLSMYNAVAGRGYWLLMTLAGIHFFAMLALARRLPFPRAAWAVLLLTGVLGCFTVPAFVYVVVSAASYLGLVFLLERDWRSIWHTGWVGSGILVGASLLYFPLLLISGWRLLLANGYVASLPWDFFLRELASFSWFTEGTLAGQRTIGAFLFIVVVFATLLLLNPKRNGRLSPELQRAVRNLCLPAIWFILLPYILISIQRVLPPERVLLYKAFYLFALAGLVLDAWLQVHPGRLWRTLASSAIMLFVAYQAFTMHKLVQGNRQYIESISNAFDWLKGRPAGRVLVGVNETSLHFLFFAHYRTPQRHWQFDTSPQLGARYRYIIVSPDYKGPYRPPIPAKPAFKDGVDEIYVLPAFGQPVPNDPSRE
ncbi:hypothetical protein Q3A66_08580 [Hymenobacter sp. BT770]|uniref:hypothetical protein n=1 Tax=Hymenobacter sp. BT770 TaxID=2886942 RepID=UPI001D12FD6D|nr:hypothetical protein [Hymenobacter sp. BT770]MCC3152965.1 hypothetical protein [Hymenobacter sp. BT770]MDO3415121.1 hypothetical protein [Hymenobacter sp. BT770]